MLYILKRSADIFVAFCERAFYKLRLGAYSCARVHRREGSAIMSYREQIAVFTFAAQHYRSFEKG
jgi:hypothetical protein